MNYREVNKKDIPQLIDLGLISYGQLKPELSEENWDLMNNNLAKASLYETLLGKGIAFVCEEENKIIGMAFLIPNGNPTSMFQSDWAYLRMVGVSPNSSNKGIARKLTQLCIDYAKETKENVLALHTSEMMDAARHLYESMGFKKIKELPKSLGKRYWLYTLDLT